MADENENLDSPNEELVGQVEPEITSDGTEILDDVTALQEKLAETEAKNRQLFERAKKAEGFELKDGKWVKKEEPKKPEAKESVKSGELDYGQLAFYNSKSDSVKIEHEEDIEFLKNTIKETGKTQSVVLNSKWFQSDLKDRQAVRITQEAIPFSTKRSVTQTRDTVEYWLAKYDSTGELPPPDQRKLREDVLNARIERDKSKDKFTDNPVIGSP